MTHEAHQTWLGKLDAYLDGELSAEQSQALDRHLRECAGCAAESLRRVQWKRAIHSAGQRYSAPSGLRQRVIERIARNEGRKWSSHLFWRWWPAFAAPLLVLLLLVTAGLIQLNRRSVRNNLIVNELVDLHVSTLASASPVDVLSSDRHTVKPWFEGKIPFTFNLPELQGTPFELVGGRVSYLQQSPGAELIFRIRRHQMTAFIFPGNAVPSDFSRGGEFDARSFHGYTFERQGLRYFVIGDATTEDIKALGELLKNAK